MFLSRPLVATLASSLLLASGCAALIGADFDRPAAKTHANTHDGAPSENDAGGTTEVPAPEPPKPDGSCSDSRKLCEVQCFSLLDPKHGCAATSCDPCFHPHGAAACSTRIFAIGGWNGSSVLATVEAYTP